MTIHDIWHCRKTALEFFFRWKVNIEVWWKGNFFWFSWAFKRSPLFQRPWVITYQLYILMKVIQKSTMNEIDTQSICTLIYKFSGSTWYFLGLEILIFYIRNQTFFNYQPRKFSGLILFSLFSWNQTNSWYENIGCRLIGCEYALLKTCLMYVCW